MYKLAALALAAVGAQSQVLVNGGALATPYGYPIAAGAPLAYAGAYAGAYAHAAPVAYAQPAVAAPAVAYAQPIAVPAPVAVAPKAYALPAVKEVREADVVQQVVEPVEIHGYSVRY